LNTTIFASEQLITAVSINKSQRVLRWSGIFLVSTVWLSALLFGLYILTFYVAAFYRSDMVVWNDNLAGLYQADKKGATLSIGLHFVAGGIILILGCIQLLQKVRLAYPKLHRWTGRIYIVACLLAATGGLIFIAISGTIGGIVMDIGFTLYGVLMLLAAFETFRHAVTKRVTKHRAWAMRLFALAIGSWLYRMDYGFWLLLADGIGHTSEFNGPFDQVMSFFFFIPNLLVAEVFIRNSERKMSDVINWIASLTLISATGFLIIGTYYFTLYYWGPAMVAWLSY